MNTHKRVVGILRELIEEDEETYSERAPLWKEKNVVWELKKRLLSVLAEPYKKRLEQFLVLGCVCDLSEEDLTKDDVYLGSKIAKSLAFE